MTNHLFHIYYSIALITVLFFYALMRRIRIPLVSYTHLAYVLAILSVIIPGYYVAAGTADDLVYRNFYRGFDFELYLLYLIFTVITPFGLILGHLTGKKRYMKTELRHKTRLRTNIMILAVVSYAAMYLLWLSDIPLHYLLTTGDFFGATIARLQSTHNLGEAYDLPFVFRYWRNILQIVFIALFLYYVAMKRSRDLRNKVKIAVLFVMLSYCLLFTLEKAPFIYLLVSIGFFSLLRQGTVYSIHDFLKSNLTKRNLLFLFGLMVVPILLYNVFMGAETTQLGVVFQRFMTQTSSNYLQIQYIREVGFLGLRGIELPIGSGLFDIEYINPSKYAIAELFPATEEYGLSGAAGGMSLTEAFYISGWICIPLFILFTLLIGLCDRVVLNTIYHKDNHEVFNLNSAFYAAFSAWFSIGLTSSAFMLFSFRYVLNASIVILLLFYLMLGKVQFGTPRRA